MHIVYPGHMLYHFLKATKAPQLSIKAVNVLYPISTTTALWVSGSKALVMEILYVGGNHLQFLSNVQNMLVKWNTCLFITSLIRTRGILDRHLWHMSRSRVSRETIMASKWKLWLIFLVYRTLRTNLSF